MIFKHQQEYDLLFQLCPPQHYTTRKLYPVYRWVFDSLTSEANFISQFHKNPKRFLNKGDAEKCDAMALSMFNNLKGCKQRFTELKEIIGKEFIRHWEAKLRRGAYK